MRYHVRNEAQACSIAPEAGDTIQMWGHEFVWTTLHKTPAQLAPLKHTADQLADAAIKELDVNRGKFDTLAALEKAVNSPERSRYPNCHLLYEQVTTVPNWVDFEQIARGQDVFFGFAGPAFTGLLNDSLLGGLGAKRISETLIRTGSFGVKSARRRLLQTTQWILEVMNGVKEGSDGWKNTIRVRLLHSMVRQRILGICDTNPEYYDLEGFGVPINDLHSLVTLTSFSSTLIDHAFPKMFVYLTRQQRDDYIALWRYIAYLIGSDETKFTSAETALACLESIMLAELWPDTNEESHSRTLLHNSIAALANQPPSNMSYDYICAQVRWLHGEEYCDALGLPQASYYAKFITASKISFFLLMAAVGHVIPGWDKRRIQRIRPILYDLVVHSKTVGLGAPVIFDMEWSPNPGSLVKRADPLSEDDLKSVRIGMEKHYFSALFVVSTTIVGLLAGSVCMTVKLFNHFSQGLHAIEW